MNSKLSCTSFVSTNTGNIMSYPAMFIDDVQQYVWFGYI